MLQIYEIRPGDSLWAIAQRFGVPLQRIIDLNDPPYLDRLTPGQTLLIPTEDEPQPPTFEYTVQPGDTLWAISRRFGVTIEDILSLNDIPDPSRIFPGQVLIIPGAAPPPEPTTYVVQPGDTLWSISQRFGVSLSDLIELNDLADQFDLPGQTLLIPPGTLPLPRRHRSPEATAIRQLSTDISPPRARRTENGLIKSAMPSAIVDLQLYIPTMEP